ncbi:MAG: hypothetical protein Q8J85_14835, partial [Sulfuricurvum sp.]|nr:hypothetical protein [Sulfuricurvum sp.]MDP3022597.1 hypothetical protein [Sulfuricurvum sp.]
SKLLFGIVVPWSIGCSSYMSLYLWSDKIDSLLHPFDLLLHFKLELAFKINHYTILINHELDSFLLYSYNDRIKI